MKKVLGILLCLTLCLSSVSVFADTDDNAKVVSERDGAVGYSTDGSSTANGTSLVFPGNDGGGVVVEGYGIAPNTPEAEALSKCKTVKTAWYLTVTDVTDSASGLRINPFFQEAQPPYPNMGEGWVDVSYSLLEEYVDEKIIIVGIYALADDFSGTNAGFIPRLWVNPGIAFNVDKVVVAGGDYNFANDPEYELVHEEANVTSGDFPIIPDEDDFTYSEETDDNTGDDNTGDDNTGDDVPVTADVSMMFALLAAGVATFGGLKLRRK